jgi:hypothetical protein
MAIHARQMKGALVYYDSTRQRIVDVVGGTVSEWALLAQDLQRPGGSTPRGYNTTVVGTSTVEASDEPGMVAEILTAVLDNDGLTMQLVGTAFRPTPARDVSFGIALQSDEATQSDFLVGLTVVTTDPLAGVTDGLYFRKIDGVTTINAVTEKDSVETQTAAVATLTANTTVTLELYSTGGSVSYYVNGVETAVHTTNIPDDESLSPVIQFLSGAAGAKRLKIAWGRAFSIG